MPLPDLSALALFCVLWLGYDPASRLLGDRTINGRMRHVRRFWMASMLRRDARITDSALFGHVVQSTSFFASASLIAIGAMISAFGTLERIQPTVEELVFVTPVPAALFEIKMLLPLAVLVYGFFKLTWAIRQLNYTIALVGAAPAANTLDDAVPELADAIAAVMTDALTTFNDGIRSYYFALAGLAWPGSAARCRWRSPPRC
jgi:uncharacterized membrane protein